jgi:hypothetical protein
MAVGKYETHVKPKLLLIEAWARDGLTDLQIAEKLGISEASFYKYRTEHKEFTESLKNGKEVIDVMVENALLKAALGYEYDETKETAAGTEITTKYAQPNTTALIFWLKNRKQREWRDKQDVEHSGAIAHEHKHDLKKLSPKELADLEHILTKTADSG